MSKTFIPEKPEEMVTVNITKREAILLGKLRAFPYGRVLVHKAEGIIIRIEPTNSIIIDPEKEDVDL